MKNKILVKDENNFTYSPQAYDLIIKGHPVSIQTCNGKFECRVESHLHGNQCRSCTINGFSKKRWVERTKNKKSFIYLIEFDTFLKVGLTTQSLKKGLKI